MKNILVISIVLLIIATTLAGTSKSQAESSEATLVSRNVIEGFLATSTQVAQVTQKHLSLSNYTGEQDLNGSQALVSYLENSSIYPQLKAILEESIFKDLTELTSFSEKLMGMRLYAQMKQSNQVSVFQTVDILTANLNTMRANSASDTIIKQTEVLLAEQVKKATAFQKLLDKTTEQDKLFIDQNLEWFMKRFAQ